MIKMDFVQQGDTYLTVIVDVAHIIGPVGVCNEENLLLCGLQSLHNVNRPPTVDEDDVV